MKRLNDNEIILTQDELNDIQDFIRNTLYREWDDHTNRFYDCKENNEEGMRRMDPKMYDMTQEIESL